MKCTLHTISAFLAIGLCLHLEAQVGECQYVPGRCVCLKPKPRVIKPISNFQIISSGAGCRKAEIILILKKGGQKVCLSPDGHQGKRLLRCWYRAQEEGKDGTKCKKRLRPRARKPQVKSKQLKS